MIIFMSLIQELIIKITQILTIAYIDFWNAFLGILTLGHFWVAVKVALNLPQVFMPKIRYIIYYPLYTIRSIIVFHDTPSIEYQIFHLVFINSEIYTATSSTCVSKPTSKMHEQGHSTRLSHCDIISENVL